MSRRSTEPIIGGYTQRDLSILSIIVSVVVVQGIIFGLIEPAFFTEWAREYNDPLNQAIILNHFSLLCVGMFIIAATTALLPAVIHYILYGWTPRTKIFLFGGIIAIPLWILFEDLFAHIRYGGISETDWTHWFFQSRIYIATNWVLPIWYILVIVSIVCLFVVFGFGYLTWSRNGGGRR